VADQTVDTDEQRQLSESTMRPGVKLGAYRLLRQIGAGGMGAVWLAEHLMLRRQAAIKVLRRDAADDEETVTRFFNEARAAAAIADPGIVQIFDFGHADDGSAYIVMELLAGEPLDARLKKQGKLAYPDALRIMRQVASSLAAAHAHGIIHRDLKPQNLFLVRDPEVPGGERAKILDFGIAKLTRDDAGVSTDTNRFMGTPLYMAPEQCRDARAVDARSDVYALGCVLFLLVTGRPVFAAGNLAEMLTKQLYEDPPRARSLAPELPAAVDDLIARCLVKDPAQRFPSASALVDAIVAATGQAPFALATTTPAAALADAAGIGVATTMSRTSGEVTIPRQALPRRTSRTALIAAACGALAMAVASAAIVSHLRRSPAAEVVPVAAPPLPDALVTPDARLEPDAALPADAGVDAAVPVDAGAPPVKQRKTTKHRATTHSKTPDTSNTVPGDIDGDGIPDQKRVPQ
jgi:serine/threonine-protein kinase